MPSWGDETTKVRATSLAVSGMLAAAGGFLDGFTYVGHGRVFANSMSGNVIMLGAYSFIGSWRVALRYLWPILAFLAAVWVAQAILLHSKRRVVSAPYAAVLLLEILVLLVLSLLPATTPDALFTTSIAFVAAVQMTTFREVNGHMYSSTFTTGNLRTLGEAAFKWLFEGRSLESVHLMRDFSVIVSAFLAGAIGGGYATKLYGNRALWGDIALLVLTAIRITPRMDLPGAVPRGR